jgi:hypothetical protein
MAVYYRFDLFFLPDIRSCRARAGLPLPDLRFFVTAAVRFAAGVRTARGILFLGWRAPVAAAALDAIVPRTVVETVSGIAERLSVKSLVVFVMVPAACPSLRARVFRRGCLRIDRFLVAIWISS